MTVFRSEPTKDGRRYRFRCSWTDGTGARHQHTSGAFMLASQAKKAEAEYLLSHNKSVAQRFTFSEMIDEYLASKKLAKPSTVSNTRNCLEHVRAVLGPVRIDNLKNEQWQSFLDYLETLKMQNHRRNRIIEYAVAVCNFANKRYGVYTPVPSRFDKFNEADDHPFGKQMEFWSPDQFQAFISAVDDPMYNSLFTLLYATGMRSGEALALRWSDFDFNGGYVSINKTVNTKLKGSSWVILPPKTRSSIRTIKGPDFAFKRLLSYRDKLPPLLKNSPDAFVFGGDRPIPNSTLQKKWHAYYQKAVEVASGLPAIRLHSLRHSCASALIGAGATIVYVSKYLGHSSVKETLDTYSHFMPSEADRMADQMDAILKNGL